MSIGSSAKLLFLEGARRARGFELASQSFWRGSRVAILCYHGISLRDEHEWLPALYVSPPTFERRMQMLADLGYRVLPLAEALQRLVQRNLPPRSVVVTFDDGFVDFYRLAWPVLKRFAFPATVYLTTYYVDCRMPVFDVMTAYLLWRQRGKKFEGLDERFGGTLDLRTAESRELAFQRLRNSVTAAELNAHEKDELLAELAERVGEDYQEIRAQRLLQIMSREEVQQICAGGVDVQLHTHRHRTPKDSGEFIREIEDNRRVINEITGSVAVHFCYPRGIYVPEFGPWLKECGVESATTCDLGLADGVSPYFIPRILDAEDISETEFESWISGFRPRWLSLGRARRGY